MALGAVSRLTNNISETFKDAAAKLEFLKFWIVDVLGMYDFFAPNWLEEAIDGEFYSSIPSAFENMLKGFDLDPSVDEIRRIRSYISHMPSGAGYRNFLHFA